MDDAEERVEAFRRAALYMRYSTRIFGPLLLLTGIVGLLQNRLMIVSIMALVVGVAACILGWGVTMIRVNVGHVHWSTEHAWEQRRFRRALRKELD